MNTLYCLLTPKGDPLAVCGCILLRPEINAAKEKGEKPEVYRISLGTFNLGNGDRQELRVARLHVLHLGCIRIEGPGTTTRVLDAAGVSYRREGKAFLPVLPVETSFNCDARRMVA